MARNVVLLVLDSVRKDYFDEYATRVRDAADVSYEQCRAVSSWSTPSHASMMTRQLPSEHGIHAHNVDFTGLKRSDTFLSELEEYTTCGVSTNVFAGTPFGFDGLFDSFTSMSRHAIYPDGLEIDQFLRDTDREGTLRYLAFLRAVLGHDHPIQSILNGSVLKFNDLLEGSPVRRLTDYGTQTMCEEIVNQLRRNEEPTFLFANFMEAHTPLQPSRPYDDSLHDVEPTWSSDDVDLFDINSADDISGFQDYLEKFRAVYGATIEYLDRQITDTVERIREATDGEATIVITADHGENLGYEADDGLLGHETSLTEGTLHVPLEVINPPEGFDSTVSGYVSHLDLGDLIVRMARGESIDITRDRVPAERVGLGLAHDPDEFEYWDRMIRCAYRGETKCVWDSLDNKEEMRIDLNRLCWESRVATEIDIPDWAYDLFDQSLKDFKSNAASGEPAANNEMNDHTRRQLEDLGYL